MKFIITATNWMNDEMIDRYPQLADFGLEKAEIEYECEYTNLTVIKKVVLVNIRDLEELLQLRDEVGYDLIITGELFDGYRGIEIYDGYRE